MPRDQAPDLHPGPAWPTNADEILSRAAFSLLWAHPTGCPCPGCTTRRNTERPV